MLHINIRIEHKAEDIRDMKMRKLEGMGSNAEGQN